MWPPGVCRGGCGRRCLARPEPSLSHRPVRCRCMMHGALCALHARIVQVVFFPCGLVGFVEQQARRHDVCGKQKTDAKYNRKGGRLSTGRTEVDDGQVQKMVKMERRARLSFFPPRKYRVRTSVRVPGTLLYSRFCPSKPRRPLAAGRTKTRQTRSGDRQANNQHKTKQGGTQHG